PYDKPGSVSRQHRETIEETSGEHGLHICAPQADTASTPVLQSSGPDDGTGRARLISADLIRLKKAYDDLKIPKMGRILILCNEHIQDLLLEDQDFKNQYQNHKEG